MLPVIVALALIAILFLILIAGRPDDFIVSRATQIAAAPDQVFPHVNELKKWDAWSPWAKLDPNAKNTFAGPAAGVGSSMSWAGNRKVGAGRMTIAESRANELIRFNLEFLRPFQATNFALFTFKSVGSQTEVSWSMTGRNNLFFKLFGLFMDCDALVGKDFENGLARLKTVAEAAK